MREDLRKPYVIGKYMFVNGIRMPGDVEDRFSITAVNDNGLLNSSIWIQAPEGFDPHRGPDPSGVASKRSSPR